MLACMGAVRATIVEPDVESVADLPSPTSGSRVAGPAPRGPGRIHPANLLLLAPTALSAWAFRKVDFLWLEAILLMLMLVAVALTGKRLRWDARPPAWCGSLRSASRNALFACLLPAVASIVLRVSLLPWIP